MRLSSLAPALVLVALTSFASPAAAQLCTGNVEVSRRAPVAIGGSLGKGDGFLSLSPSVVAGLDNFFVRATVDSTGFENRDERSLGVFGQVGGQFHSGRLHACPSVSVGRTSGPDTDDYTLSSKSVYGGVVLGFIARETATARIVPSLNLSLSRYSSTFDWGEDFELGKASGTAKAAAFGVGYVRDHFSIQPSVLLSFAGGEVNPAYYLEVYWSPGTR